MDPPESPPPRQPSLANASLYEDSPVFDFINSLSPIGTPKPLDPAQNVHLFKSPDLLPVSSIFTSPQVNPQKETKPRIRDGYAQLSQGVNSSCQRNQIGISSCIELSGSPTVALEICSPSEDATILPSKWPQSIQLGSETLGDAKTQDTDGKADHVADVAQGKQTQDTDGKADHGSDVGQGKLSSSGYDQNGVGQMDSSTSGRNVQENDLAKQYNDDLAACSLNHLISHSGTGNGVMSKSGLSLEAQQLSWNLKCDDVIFGKSMPMNQGNLEDSRRKIFDGSTGCYIQSAADNAHVQCAGAAEGVATNHGPEMHPGVIQSQLVSNEYFFDASKVPSDDMNAANARMGGVRALRASRRRVEGSEQSGRRREVEAASTKLRAKSATLLESNELPPPVRSPSSAGFFALHNRRWRRAVNRGASAAGATVRVPANQAEKRGEVERVRENSRGLTVNGRGIQIDPHTTPSSLVASLF